MARRKAQQTVEVEPEVVVDLDGQRTDETAEVKTQRAKKDKSRPCACECGGTTKGGRFLPGHDAVLKSKLLKAHDAGDASATERLLAEFHYTAEGLDARKANGNGGNKVERLKSKLAKVNERILALEAQAQDIRAAIEAAEAEN